MNDTIDHGKLAANDSQHYSMSHKMILSAAGLLRKPTLYSVASVLLVVLYVAHSNKTSVERLDRHLDELSVLVAKNTASLQVIGDFMQQHCNNQPVVQAKLIVDGQLNAGNYSEYCARYALK